MSSIQPGQFSFPPSSAFLNPVMQQVPPQAMPGMPMSQYTGMPPAFAGRKHEAGSTGANQHFIGTLSIASVGLLFLAYLGGKGLVAKVAKFGEGHFKQLGEWADKVVDFAKTQWAKVAKKTTEAAAETAASA